MTDFSEDRAAELRELFFESAAELLQNLNEAALRLERTSGDLESLRTMRRAVHTLKGDAAACGYRDLSSLAHDFEDLLASEDLAHSRITVEAAFAAADLFSATIGALKRGTRAPSAQPFRRLLQQLEAPVSRKTPEPGKALGKSAKPSTRVALKKSAVRKSRKSTKKFVEPVSTNPWTEYEILAIHHARTRNKTVHLLNLHLDPNCAMPEAALQMVRSILTSNGELLALHPGDGATLARRGHLHAALASALESSVLLQKCKIPAVITRVSGQVLNALPLPPKAEPETAAPGKETPEPEATELSATEHWLRVDADRVDTILNLIGELILGKSMLQQVVTEFNSTFPKHPLRTKLADAFSFQTRVLNDLQRAVTKIRMVPVSQLFRRFPRLVRDTARECNREVELRLSGKETELDKSILDALAEPIAHLLRNAISHGIEDPSERARNGKSAQGSLTLSAYHQGHQVVIELNDDGRGIDSAKIRKKAVERGFITEGDSIRLDENELSKFIFLPGFTTADEVTAISGRGVGLDVVQAVLQRLKGSVSVDSQPGKGTTFRLQLPLTLAIIKAILFNVDGRLFAIPLNAVLEMLRTAAPAVHLVDGREVMQRRNEVLPLLRLGAAQSPNPDGKLFVLVVSLGGQKLGLIVDDLAGQDELVIKPLDSHIFAGDLVSGVSILGDGKVVLIVNLAAVYQQMRTRRAEPGQAPWGILLPATDTRKDAVTASAQAGGAQ